ncbi:hypothetical protein V8F06_013894, partial [Rhypophila decipiens]
MAFTLLDIFNLLLAFPFLTTIFIAITVPLCYRLSRRSPPKPPTPKPPTPKRLPVRITNIPPDTSRENVERQLRSIAVETHVITDASVYHLVPTNRGTVCTTATVCTSSSENELLQRLHEALPYSFDCHFYGITSLYTPQIGADADIVAVPGLGSHAIRAWQSSTRNDVWLRDYLPRDLPAVRVLLYGYDTTLLKSNSRKSINDLGSTFLECIKAFRASDRTSRRPIIFIGYSLGGLLVKEALVQAHRKSADLSNLDLCKACCGMLFFGVPNLGLRHQQLTSITQGQPNRVLINDLVVDGDTEPSNFLKRLAEQFSDFCKSRYRVISFYECRHSPTVEIQPDGTLRKTGSGCLMVTEKSATSTGLVAVTDEVNIAFDTDHTGLVKYDSQDHMHYPIVEEQLKKLVNEQVPQAAQRFAEAHLTAEQKSVWDNLNDPPYSSFRNSAKLAKPEKGTLEWLLCNDDGGLPLQDDGKNLRADDYISWRDSDTAERLLVTAAPGQGKSVLSNFVLSDLERRPRDRCKVIYYFCNIRNEAATRNANSILRALIVQLCESRRRFFEILPNKYTDDHSQFFSAPLDTLLQTFQSMLGCDPLMRVYCVIDGLDVYKEGMQDLINGLSNIFNIGNGAHYSPFKLLCTTRPHPDTQHTWGGARSKNLRCNPKDIEIFLHSRTDSLGPTFKQFSELILDELQSKSEKTFLWIDVVLRKIHSLRYPSMKRVKETIARSSQDLYELYRELLASVNDQDGISARILNWILYAKRPLQLRELEDAIALTPTAISTGISTSYGDWRKEKPSLDDIYLDLGTLLDIVDDKVYFIHQSVKDFLEEQNPLENAFHDVKPRLFPAYISMAYLALEEMGHQLWNTKKLDKEYPLLEYAARYWYDHIESTADVYSQAPLQGFLRKLVDPASRNTQLWMMVADPWMKDSSIRSRSQIATVFNIGWLAELLLDGKIEDLPSDFEEYGLEGVERAKSVLLVVIGHENSKGLVLPRAVVRGIAESHDHVMMKALLEKHGGDIQITPEVVVAAAGNWECGKGVMEILLEKRGGDIQITPEMVVAAAGNMGSGEGVMK